MGDEDREEPTAAPTSKEQVEMNKINNAIAALAPKEMDTASVAKMMSLLSDDKKETGAAEAQRQKELAAVKVAPEDIDLIVSEFELPKAVAELALREHKGDPIATMRSLVAAQ